MADLIHRFRYDHPDGSIEQCVIWEVPRSPRNPEGIRYRLAYIPAGASSPTVLYDNHHPKGHHKHIRGIETAYEYVDWEKLIEDFEKDKKANARL